MVIVVFRTRVKPHADFEKLNAVNQQMVALLSSVASSLGSGMVPKATYDLAIIDVGMNRKTVSRNQHPTALRTDATRALRRAVSTTLRVRSNRSSS
jgi:hypothetical protein